MSENVRWCAQDLSVVDELDWIEFKATAAAQLLHHSRLEREMLFGCRRLLLLISRLSRPSTHHKHVL